MLSLHPRNCFIMILQEALDEAREDAARNEAQAEEYKAEITDVKKRLRKLQVELQEARSVSINFRNELLLRADGQCSELPELPLPSSEPDTGVGSGGGRGC